MTRSKIASWLAAGCPGWALLAGCVAPSDGLRPTADLYFPTGLAVSPGGGALYVASSDFDLQYNAGTVQAYDLATLRGSPPSPGSAAGSSSGLLGMLDVLNANPTLGADQLCAQIAARGLSGLHTSADPVSAPGPCSPASLGAYLKKSIEIGAFATDLAFVCQANSVSRGGTDCEGGEAGQRTSNDPSRSNARLFVPVRGDPSLTYFEVTDDRPGAAQDFHLFCGEDANDGRCNDAHRLGITPFDNTRGLTLPVEPFELSVSDGARAIVVTHQVGGRMSVFSPKESGPDTNVVATEKPLLQYVLGSLPGAVTGVAALPIPKAVLESTSACTPTMMASYQCNYNPGFLVGFRSAPQIYLVRYYDDRAASPSRPFIQAVGGLGVGAAASVDSRSIAVDSSASSARRVCEGACPACPSATPTDPACIARASCLAACVAVPVPFYVGSRAYDSGGNPTLSTLIVGQAQGSLSDQGSGDIVGVLDAVPLSYGVSRVVVGHIRDQHGISRTRVFASLFEARALYIYDPEARRIEAVVGTGRGPYAIAIDPVEPLAYVAHFTDSYIGVVDLDATHPITFETMFATLGVPRVPREAQ